MSLEIVQLLEINKADAAGVEENDRGSFDLRGDPGT
jgi:hypothetical protein